MHDPRTPVRYVRARSDIVAALGRFLNIAARFSTFRHELATKQNPLHNNSANFNVLAIIKSPKRCHQ